MNQKAALYTLGCKLNQFETMFLQEQLEKAGYAVVPFEDRADVYIINTCTVTGKGDYRSRMKIRQAVHNNPEALIVATGCSAQVNPERLAAIEGVDLVLGNADKGSLIKYLAPLKKKGAAEIQVSRLDRETQFNVQFIHRFPGYTRAFLKIQEGCDNCCSYCTVPAARGKNRSARVEDVLWQAGQLVENGYKELVLTGIHLGTYGAGEETTLADLLEALLDRHESIRLRLSSIEPTEFTPALKRVVTRSERICAHLHIPLQGGDDRLLQKMHRPYTLSFYKTLIEELVSLRPEVAIGADVMVGFPGETEGMFRGGYRFIEALPLAYLHVFSYSVRPGTEAASLPGQIDGRIKRERCTLLRELSRKKFYRFRQSFSNHPLPALVLGQRDEQTKDPVALTGNYIKVVTAGADSLINQQIMVMITKVSEEKTFGRIMGKENFSDLQKEDHFANINQT